MSDLKTAVAVWIDKTKSETVVLGNYSGGRAELLTRLASTLSDSLDDADTDEWVQYALTAWFEEWNFEVTTLNVYRMRSAAEIIEKSMREVLVIVQESGD